MPGAYAAVGAPIASKSAAEQIVTAPVLVPNTPDRERHRYSAENIAAVANSFLPRGGVDAEHFGSDVARPTESYVAPQQLEVGGRGIPSGSWMVSAKVTDEDVWGRVETGEITGMSVQGPVAAVYDSEGNELSKEEFAVRVGSDDAVDMAMSRPPDAAASLGSTTPDSAIEGAKSPGLAAQGKQWTIAPAPVGEIWDVELARADFVSLVSEPAVSEAQFVVAKAASAGGGGPGTQSSTDDDIIMNDELEERLDSIAESVDASAQAAKAAAESADEAQEAAAEAQAASEESGDDGGGSGESNGEDYTAADLKGELEEEGVLGDSGEGNGGTTGSEGAVNETLRTLVDAGVVNPEDLDDEDLDLDFDAEEVSELSPELEKRLATIEKAVQTPGRRGKASNLDALGSDDEDGDGSVSGERDFASALTAGGDN
jgi:hypothetical protein